VAALIFACLGVALALRGKRAIRARFLNAGAIATSVFMNFAAAGHGWRDLAIWMMPPVAYALASDTAIANVRSWALVRRGLADDDSSPLAVAGRMILYLNERADQPAGNGPCVIHQPPQPKHSTGTPLALLAWLLGASRERQRERGRRLAGSPGSRWRPFRLTWKGRHFRSGASPGLSASSRRCGG
jgi:hypothetical protein